MRSLKSASENTIRPPMNVTTASDVMSPSTTPPGTHSHFEAQEEECDGHEDA